MPSRSTTISAPFDSLHTLSQLVLNGDNISGDTVLASISLDFDEAALAGIEKNADGSLATNPLAFTINANLDETVFSNQLDDGSGLENRTIQTLWDSVAPSPSMDEVTAKP